jgi:hypothetical protein
MPWRWHPKAGTISGFVARREQKHGFAGVFVPGLVWVWQNRGTGAARTPPLKKDREVSV